MAAKKVSFLRPYKDYTHTLTIKLHSSSLLPQLETSFQRFRKDALAAGIPERAFLPPEFAGMHLGKLLLETPRRRDDFSKFLHSIDYRKLFRAPESARSSFAATEEANTAHSRSHVAPLRINYTGLSTTARDPSKALDLYLLTIDPTGRLQPFLSSLIDCFMVAGFPILKPVPKQDWRFVSSAITERGRSNPFVVKPMGRRFYVNDRRLPRFDTRELLKKYESTIWAKDIRLERLSLLQIGATEKNPDGETVMKPQPEIDSVALHDDDPEVGSYSPNE